MEQEKLIEVFRDTEKIFSSKVFESILKHSKKETYICKDPEFFANYVNNLENQFISSAEIKVTNRDTLSAASEYAKISESSPTNRITAILNFASATTPGGGVVKGSTAQEECICRCSSLYPVLNQPRCWHGYYNVNRAANTNLGSDTVIYSPDILVFKDKHYNLLEKENQFYVDVITCAAPNLREKPSNLYNDGASKTQLTLTDEELYNIHVARAKAILNVAIYYNVEYLVLGAFGCGAFKNKPEIVAKAYKDVLPEYMHYFRVIDFAIIDGKNSNNFEVFKRVLLQ